MAQRSNRRMGRRQLGPETVLWRCRRLSRESAGTKGVTLFFSESGEFVEVDAHVANDLTHQAASDVFTFVDRDDRDPSVVVLPKRMTPLLSDEPKSQARENCLQLARRDGCKASHAGTSS